MVVVEEESPVNSWPKSLKIFSLEGEGRMKGSCEKDSTFMKSWVCVSVFSMGAGVG